MTLRDESELPLAESLTPREQEILRCLGDGLSNRQIAEQLTVSLNTVKWYVRQIYKKLSVANRGEAVSKAQRFGMLPAAKPRSPIRNNLPLAPTPFVGRQIELTALTELINDPQVRTITIIGPGGIGKTRLALELSGDQLTPAGIADDEQTGPSFPDGIFFVSLASVDSAEGIITKLATTLDIQFHSVSQMPRTETQQVLDYLERKQMLLIMDNFEQILDGRSLLAEIGQRAAEIKLLVTSRERLQLRGEQLFPLQGLEVPQIDDSGEDSLAGYAAAQLFLNIARRVQPDFKLRQGHADHLIRICRLLEGMPLGLELAASWVSVLSLSNIADEIEQSLHLLTANHHDLPERHRSLIATLDASWNRLNPEQTLIFQKLTTFRGGFTRAAALEAAGATLPLLVTLLNKSWISYEWQRDRYNIHRLLQQYGAGKLRADPELEQEIRDMHGAYFCSYLKERETDLSGPRQVAAAAEVQTEIDNIQAAWSWAANQGDVTLLSQGLTSLCRFYQREGRRIDGQIACRSARDGLSAASNKDRAGDPRLLALLSQILAWESEFVNEIAQKQRLLAESQGILDRLPSAGPDTRAEQAFIYLEKAYAAQDRDHGETIHLSEQALELYRELGDRWGEANALGLAGGNYALQGSYELAIKTLNDTLAIRQQIDDIQGIAKAVWYLGVVATHQGKYEQAESLHAQSLTLFQQLRNRQEQRSSLAHLSYARSWAGKFPAAREAASRLSELDRDLGQFPNPSSLNPLAKATVHLGHYTEAKALATESLNIARSTGNLSQAFPALVFLGMIAFAEEDTSGAKDHLLESVSVVSTLGHIFLVVPRATLSYVLRAQSDGQLARKYLASAIHSAFDHRSITPLMYGLPIAALFAADEGHIERAVELHTLAQQFGHIAKSCWFEQIASRELESLASALPLEIASAAKSRGRELDIWVTAEQLLKELTIT